MSGEAPLSAHGLANASAPFAGRPGKTVAEMVAYSLRRAGALLAVDTGIPIAIVETEWDVDEMIADVAAHAAKPSASVARVTPASSPPAPPEPAPPGQKLAPVYIKKKRTVDH